MLSLFRARTPPYRQQLALHIYFFILAGEIFDFELLGIWCKSVSQQPQQRRRIIYDKIKFEMLIDAERAREF
jgi:hypothetical protein